MNKKANMIIFLILIFILILNGCRKETIKIGIVGTMTGSQSDLSVSGRRGIEIAVDQINKNGGIRGKKLELIIKDDLNDAIRAKEIVSEFVKEDIKIVVGHYTSGEMIAAYDEVIKHDILYLGPTISADSFSGLDDNFIRFIASTKEQAQIIADFAIEQNHKNFI